MFPDTPSTAPASPAPSPTSEVPAPAKPDLVICPGDLTTTARQLAKIIAASGRAFDRAGPVQVVKQADGQIVLVPLTPDSTVLLSHELARPVALNGDGKPTAQTLPVRVANLYLALQDWGLQPLEGITTAPLLSETGAIRTACGYDPATALWCVPPPDLRVPLAPTVQDAKAALALIRRRFSTYAFADAHMVSQSGGVQSVDLDSLPDHDESGFLTGLLTAICRPSLPLAPGLLITAPAISGAGTGKGNLVRGIAQIAFGYQASAFTAGKEAAELEKRIASALIEARQVVAIDNANMTSISCDLLASALTERKVVVRPLGSSQMLPLWAKAFVALTGNGLSVSEDLARRFLVVNLDAHMEDPEARSFPPGFLAQIAADRADLLAAGLTIWRWGRQNQGALRHGRPMGSFEEWAAWVRDPLLTLGCRDPAERVREIKANDPLRRNLGEVFACWWEAHGAQPKKAADLAPSVLELIDPQGGSRQYVASFLGKHAGTRVNGFELTVQKPVGRWGTITYALRQTADAPRPGTG